MLHPCILATLALAAHDSTHANPAPPVTALSAPAAINASVRPLSVPTTSCITPEQRAEIDASIRSVRDGRTVGAAMQAGGEPPLLQFYPQGGNLYGDIFPVHFVDLDASSGLTDWSCTERTYDGHKGIDTIIRSFAEQQIGVPVFSVADGEVLDLRDGHPDMNTACTGLPANMVVIDHGFGRTGFYWHLKSGSVSVTRGELIPAGTQIGLTGSSGCSAHPHLHFEMKRYGEVRETFAGPCRPGPSDWADQIPIRGSTYLLDIGIARSLDGQPGSPHRYPTSPQIAAADNSINVWFLAHNLPAFTTGESTFVKPNGAIAGTSPINLHNGVAYPWAGGYFLAWPGGAFQTTGTWTVRVTFDDTVVAEVPFEVVNTIDPDFNRPPEPIDVALDPVSPGPDDVILARVQTDLLLDDPDLDLVRYRYVWKVNGVTVRNIVSAGGADAIPRGTAWLGATVRCTVTPNDGMVNGPSASASAVVGVCPNELNGDGAVGFADLLQVLERWGACAGCPEDLDGNGTVGFADLLELLTAWGPCG